MLLQNGLHCGAYPDSERIYSLDLSRAKRIIPRAHAAYSIDDTARTACCVKATIRVTLTELHEIASP